MLYQFVKSTAAHLNVGLAYRALREVKFGTLYGFVYNYMGAGWGISNQNERDELFPNVMHIELTTYCGERCKGCYITLEERMDKSTIDLDTARKAVEVGIKWGIKHFGLIGGEPISGETIPLLHSLLLEYPQLSFYCCTNGKYLASNKNGLDEIILHKNLSIGLSIEGHQETNDYIRGKGSFQNVMDATEILRSKKCFFGSVVTLRPENYIEATSDEFVEFIINKGFSYMFYSVPDHLLKEAYESSLASLRLLRKKPIFVYISRFGHADDLFPRTKARDIDVTKKGDIYPGRKRRQVIGNLDSNLGDIINNPSWLARFQN